MLEVVLALLALHWYLRYRDARTQAPSASTPQRSPSRDTWIVTYRERGRPKTMAVQAASEPEAVREAIKRGINLRAFDQVKRV